MKIAVVGSLREGQEGRDYGGQGTFADFRQLSAALGRAVAKAGHTLCIAWSQNNFDSVIGKIKDGKIKDGKNLHPYWRTADYHALCGFWAEAQELKGKFVLELHVAGPELTAITPFPDPKGFIDQQCDSCVKEPEGLLYFNDEKHLKLSDVKEDELERGNVRVKIRHYQDNHSKRQILLTGAPRNDNFKGIVGEADLVIVLGGGKATSAVEFAARDKGVLLTIPGFWSQPRTERSLAQKLDEMKKNSNNDLNRFTEKIIEKGKELILESMINSRDNISNFSYNKFIKSYKGDGCFPSVVIVSITQAEFSAMREEISKYATMEIGPISIEGVSYDIYKMTTDSDRKLCFAHCKSISQGPLFAASATSHVIRSFDPSLIIVEGIAGGIAPKEAFLGDVVLVNAVVDNSVVLYNFDSQIVPTLQPREISEQVSRLINNLKINRRFEEMFSANAFSCPELPPEQSIYASSLNETQRQSLEEAIYEFSRKPRPPKIELGAAISSGMLVENPTFSTKMVNAGRNLRIIEMEAAGFLHEARQYDPSYDVLCIRGISDLIGVNRDLTEEKGWKAYACKSAAVATSAVLHALCHDHRLLSTRRQAEG